MEAKIKLVTTISGNEVERKKCAIIGGEYYEKEVDCVDINGRWYRKSNPKIYFNSVENKWMKISTNTTTGICGYNQNDNSYTFGSFEKYFEGDYKMNTARGAYFISNKELFNSIPKVYDRQNGIFYDYAIAANKLFNPMKDYPGNKYIYSFDRLYNSENLIPLFSKVDNSKYTKQLISKKQFDLIDKYSFGLEIETSAGILPEYKCKQLGLIPLKDGSIGGHEYTTIPMKGNDGINLLMNQFEAIKSECTIDKECSLHVHFGNFNINEENILRLYNLCYYLQDEIGEIFPYYIFNSGQYKSSGKDYCKKLPGDASSIEALYSYFSGGLIYEGSFTEKHPSDPNRAQKWNNNKRYYFVNFINAMFGENPKTIEFRIHTPTFNTSKVINWMFICMSILNYAEKSDSSITSLKGIKLKDVINFSNNTEVAEIINDYISIRKEFYKKCTIVYNDYYGALDLIQDCNVKYKTPYDS